MARTRSNELRPKIYSTALPEAEWLVDIAQALIEDRELPLGLYVRRVGPSDPLVGGLTIGVELSFDPNEFHALNNLPEPEYQAERMRVYKAHPHVTTFLELHARGILDRVAVPVLDFMRREGFEDWLILTAGATKLGRLLIAAPWPREVRLSPEERDEAHRLCVHLSAALRLRAETPLPAKTSSTARLWQEILRGERTIEESFDTGQRRIIVVRRAPNSGEALTKREREVVSFAARGYSNKLIGYHLELSSSTAATHIKNALKKLGIPTRVELVKHANMLGGYAQKLGPARAETRTVNYSALERTLEANSMRLARLLERDQHHDATRRMRARQLELVVRACRQLLETLDL